MAVPLLLLMATYQFVYYKESSIDSTKLTICLMEGNNLRLWLPFQSVLLQKLQMTYEQCTLGSEWKHLSARYLMDHFMVNRWCSKYTNFHGYFNYSFDRYGLVYFIYLPNMYKRPEIFFTLIFTLQSLNLWKFIKCISFPRRLRTKQL